MSKDTNTDTSASPISPITIWHNGEFKDDSEAVFTASDRIRLGDGVFDTMLAVDGEIMNADHHLARLLFSAESLGIITDYHLKDLITVAQELIKKNGASEGSYTINTILSRGVGERGLKVPLAEDTKPELVMRAAKAPEAFPPVQAIIAQNVKRNEGSPLSQMKTFNYGDNILAFNEAQRANANEAIMLNNLGRVACATSANILMGKGGKLYTPPLEDGAMNGITRALLIEDGTLTEQSLYPEDIQTADALFIVNAVRGIMPVLTLDGEELLQTPIQNYLDTAEI